MMIGVRNHDAFRFSAVNLSFSRLAEALRVFVCVHVLVSVNSSAFRFSGQLERLLDRMASAHRAGIPMF